jgi:peptidoglycan-N-acetylglucosamine deacetylase
MIIAKAPQLLTKLLPRLTWELNGEEKNVYLTFDDGPTPDVTPWVLDKLKKYDAKATFFALGRNVEHNPDIFNQILSEGHSVGNHTYSHLKGWGCSNSTYLEDIELANRLINSKLFRPPYGRIKPSQVTLLQKSYKIIMWSVLSIDYNRRLAGDTCVRNVMDNVRPGSIIVFHDSAKARKNLYHALPVVLERLREKGFGMKGISS